VRQEVFESCPGFQILLILLKYGDDGCKYDWLSLVNFKLIILWRKPDFQRGEISETAFMFLLTGPAHLSINKALAEVVELVDTPS